MADLDENLVTFLKDDSTVTAITSNVHVNHAPESKSLPYIWLQMNDRAGEQLLDSSKGPKTFFFDIECTAINLDKAKDLQAAVTAALDGASGTFGTQKIAFADVSSQDDSYQTRQEFGDDENLHVSALNLELGVDDRS